jgi:hypothetical protein
MNKMYFMMSILFLVANISIAADKGLDRKQIYELRERCGKNAAEYFPRSTLCGGTERSYTNHYNVKLNVCFIDVKETCGAKHAGTNGKLKFAEYLIDIDENKEYGTYYGLAGSIDNKSTIMCKVGELDCENVEKFWKLIKPYMTE